MFTQKPNKKYSLTQAVEDLKKKVIAFQQKFPMEEYKHDLGYVQAMQTLFGLLEIYTSIDQKGNYSYFQLKNFLDAFQKKYAEIGSLEEGVHAIDITGPYSYLLAQHHLPFVRSFYHVYEPRFKTIKPVVAKLVNLIWAGCTHFLDKKAQKEATVMERRLITFANSYNGQFYQLEENPTPQFR